ncbi:hypothetical protein BV898_00611 [Hypsibius exemplaris]|uniref:G-protein coupled receptors family 1 profile domain-containing protein n=1 Tax=Hypsibius exemplaris TaxID=2072580 RepID=A0A1W0XDY1_HYPEX|nr:hypothetical protein BV898_00611 [Hypsibius exemplaris]
MASKRFGLFLLASSWATSEFLADHPGSKIVDPILAFCILLATNSLLVQQLFKHQKTRQSLRSARGRPDNGRYAVILSMGCAFLFLICKTPSFVYIALQVASRPPFCTYRITNFAAPHWVAFVWLFSTINYSANFYLYCAISKMFRRQLESRFPRLSFALRKLRNCFWQNRGPGSPASSRFISADTETTNDQMDFS